MKKRFPRVVHSLFQKHGSLVNSKSSSSTYSFEYGSKKIAFQSFLQEKNAMYTGGASHAVEESLLPSRQTGSVSSTSPQNVVSSSHFSPSQEPLHSDQHSCAGRTSHGTQSSHHQRQHTRSWSVTSSFRRNVDLSRHRKEFLAAKDLLGQIKHTSSELSKLVRRAVTESRSGNADSGPSPSSVVASLDARVSAIVDTMHHLLSGWTPKRYQIAFQEDVSVTTESRYTVGKITMPLIASLIRQLLVVDRAFLSISSIRADSVSAPRAMSSQAYHFKDVSGRVHQWQSHSGTYTHLRWLLNTCVQKEMAWLHFAPLESTQKDVRHHQFVYQTIWKAAHCCRRRFVRQQFENGEKPLGDYDLLLPITSSMLIGPELKILQYLRTETRDGANHDERMKRLLTVPSAEEWCMRWWLQEMRPLVEQNETSLPFFGPSRFNHEKQGNQVRNNETDSSSVSSDSHYPLSVQQAMSVISLIVPRASSRTAEKTVGLPTVSPLCGGFFVQEYVSSLNYWFQRRMEDKDEVASSGLFWIHSITLACRAVEFFPSSIGQAFLSEQRTSTESDGELKGSLNMLFQLLVDAIPLIMKCAAQLNGEHVSYLLHTFSLLGYSGNIHAPSGETKNLYVVLAHRAGQLADVLKPHEMQRILQAVDKIQLQARANRSGVGRDEATGKMRRKHSSSHNRWHSGKASDEKKPMESDSAEEEMDNTLRLALESAFRMKKIWKH